MANILKAIDVNFQFVLEYPGINICANQATFINGSSGCGKTTLLKLFNGTLSPDEGTLFYNEIDLNTLDTVELRKEVLLVSQSVYLFQGSIKDNFKEYYRYRGLELISEEQMRHYLALCCVDFPLDACCDTMSCGERQRVYIALCMSFLPRVLMLDEPTSALDEKTAHEVLGNIKQFCSDNGITMVVVCHDDALANTYADTVITIVKGASSCKGL